MTIKQAFHLLTTDSRRSVKHYTHVMPILRVGRSLTRIVTLRIIIINGICGQLGGPDISATVLCVQERRRRLHPMVPRFATRTFKVCAARK